MKAPNFEEIIPLLHRARIDFILVGGAAATAHGSARITQDVDIVYSRSDENQRRIVEALRPYNPYPRGAPRGLPFQWDQRTLKAGLNFTLQTSLGLIDILGEVAGGGSYDQLLPHTTIIEGYGV